jgi:hypothetical protein
VPTPLAGLENGPTPQHLDFFDSATPAAPPAASTRPPPSPWPPATPTQGIADPPPADRLLSTAAVLTPPSAAVDDGDVLFPSHADGALPSAAVLGQAFAGSPVPTGPGWVWGSDMLAAFLSLSRKDSQGNAWGI